MKVKVLVAQSCSTLCNMMDCSPPGSSVHKISQARILEWVAIPFSSGSSQPMDRTQISYIAGKFFISVLPGKPIIIIIFYPLVQLSSVAQSCPTICDPRNRSMPGLPVHHQLPEFTQTHVHRVGDAIQPSHPVLSPSLPALNPSQYQGLFQ